MEPCNKNDLAIALSGRYIYNINGVIGIEDPVELNEFIIVMQSGKRYLVTVSDYKEERKIKKYIPITIIKKY